MFNDVRPYITKDEPFGPIDSGDIDSHDLKALLMLFEKHNWIYKNLHSRPSQTPPERTHGAAVAVAAVNAVEEIGRGKPRHRVRTRSGADSRYRG